MKRKSQTMSISMGIYGVSSNYNNLHKIVERETKTVNLKTILIICF